VLRKVFSQFACPESITKSEDRKHESRSFEGKKPDSHNEAQEGGGGGRKLPQTKGKLERSTGGQFSRIPRGIGDKGEES